MLQGKGDAAARGMRRVGERAREQARWVAGSLIWSERGGAACQVPRRCLTVRANGRYWDHARTTRPTVKPPEESTAGGSFSVAIR